jgi:hypothetical protein
VYGESHADSGPVYRHDDMNRGERHEMAYRGEVRGNDNRMDSQEVMSDAQNRQNRGNSADVQNQASERTTGSAPGSTSNQPDNATDSSTANPSGNAPPQNPPAGQQANPNSASTTR